MRKPFLKQYDNKKSGFSLIEVMAVLFVVSLGLIGVMSLIVQSIQVRYINKNNMIAYQLAQEGIELIRHVRDTNWQQSEPWLTDMGTGEYCIDYKNPSPSATSGQGCRLYMGTDDFYDNTNDAGDTATAFFRKVVVNQTATSTADIAADISWKDHNKDYSYHLETVLYDWK